MRFRVNIKQVPSGRLLKSDTFEAQTAELAIAQARRYFMVADGPWATVTARPARPYVARRQNLGCRIRDEDRKASAGDDGPCVPLALAAVTGASYEDTNAALLLVGARRGRYEGTKTFRLPKACDLLGFEAIDERIRLAGESLTLRALALESQFQRGTFVVCTRTHALALIDGKYIDNANTSDLCRVAEVWRIIKPTKLLTAPSACAAL